MNGQLSGDPMSKLLSDRKLLAGTNKIGSKGLIGKAAVDSVESKFDKSEIGTIRMGTTLSAAEYVKKLNR